jgi:predicted nucleotidyltransferase component of viral defense system
MEGLSESAKQIIDPLSKLEFLKDYQLIGGTALSLQIKHRLSEDLDFCQWIPTKSVKYALDANQIHAELKKLFGKVDMNHIDFYQVNFLVIQPEIRITFYHTDLKKPDTNPLHLCGNIYMATKEVLGGSKLYVITQRNEIRDYYDIYVLLKEGHATLDDILVQAQSLSREANPKALFRKLSKFDISKLDLDKFEGLTPKYKVSPKEYQNFFIELSQMIRTVAKI